MLFENESSPLPAWRPPSPLEMPAPHGHRLFFVPVAEEETIPVDAAELPVRRPKRHRDPCWLAAAPSALTCAGCGLNDSPAPCSKRRWRESPPKQPQQLPPDCPRLMCHLPPCLDSSAFFTGVPCRRRTTHIAIASFELGDGVFPRSGKGTTPSLVCQRY